MLVRQVVIPASPEELWSALTEPEALAAWFGSQVEWDLRPGGRAHFVDDDGTIWGGTIDEVRPARHLSFRWWPEGEGHTATSQVSYDLQPDDDGTLLTVTEEPLAAPAAPAHVPTASARDQMASWTAWDSWLLRCWADAVLADTPALVGGRAVR